MEDSIIQTPPLSEDEKQAHSQAKQALRQALVELVAILDNLGELQPLAETERGIFKKKLEKVQGELFNNFDQASFALYERRNS